MVDTEIQQEAVTFFSWVENVGSSEIIHISGGQKIKDSNDRIMFTAESYVKFNMGILHTADPEAIKILRGFIKKGANITEDREVFNRHVMEPAKQLDRAALLHAQDLEEKARLGEENSRLRAQLEAQASPDVKRKSA